MSWCGGGEISCTPGVANRTFAIHGRPWGGELAALAGLRPLGHLDLEVVRVHEVLARDAETRGRDLLDRAPPRVAVSVAPVARRVLAALAVFDFPPMRFIAIASVSWASWLIEP